LPDGVVVIEGENRSGKTTFADLIYFGLGGKVAQFERNSNERHLEITSDVDNYVTLVIDINKSRYTIKRFIGDNDILVLPEGEEAFVYPIIRRAEQKTFSDWMLEQLDIAVFSIHSGSRSGKINLTDLMRLMYHDQETDPAGIFKKPDVGNFVTDSREFRRAIFEILTGKASQDYYNALAELKKAERALSESEGALRAFTDAAAITHHGGEDLNLHFLKKSLDDGEARLARLYQHRESLKNRPPSSEIATLDVARLRKEITETEMLRHGRERQLANVTEELRRIQETKEEFVADVSRIQKIIQAHERLDLFSPDTCPCCLREIRRPVGTCLCGQPVNEDDYERFFYSTSEYKDILKARQKNVDTIEIAIADCKREIDACKKEIEAFAVRSAAQQEELLKHVTLPPSSGYSPEFDATDSEIIKLQVELESLRNKLEIEKRREEIDRQVKDAQTSRDSWQRRVQHLDAAMQEDIAEKREQFERIYNSLMTETVKECRRAWIDANYMPVINEGEYREASSIVGKRLLYFLSLLSLSLQSEDVPFPRFLLIDTPETAGIDKESLLRILGKIFEIAKGRRGCQIILTTGIGKYPPEQADSVVLSLEGTSKLLTATTPPTSDSGRRE
jgi:hypothetical protein